jgi:hypothetical protein
LHLHEEANVVENIMPLEKGSKQQKRNARRFYFILFSPSVKTSRKMKTTQKRESPKTPGKQKV